MANISEHWEQKILDAVLRGETVSMPDNVYCGLVSDSGTDNELEQNDLTNEITGYTGNRKQINFSAVSWEDEDKTNPAEVENENLLEFEDMPSGAVKYAIVCDADDGGNIIYWCPLKDQKTVNAGDTFQLPISDLVCDLD